MTPTMQRGTAGRRVAAALYAALLVSCLLLAASCSGRKQLLPDSGGRPFEVTLVNDSDSVLAGELGGDAAGMPQREPQFDVSRVMMRPQDLETSVLRYSRAIVVADIDSRRFDRTTVASERDVYAEPQLIVRVSAPSTSAMRRELRRGTIAGLLLRYEAACAVGRLSRRRNPKMEAEVKRMFGIRIMIPSDMTSMKLGRNFIWMSNNSPTAMQNICVYLTDRRDSVMRANIKGETDSMYVITTPGSVAESAVTVCGRAVTVRRGLWEMKGDAMGGPFVSHTLSRGQGRADVTVEAFVYAPGMKKRNLLMQTEAALWTAQTGGTHGKQKQRTTEQ